MSEILELYIKLNELGHPRYHTESSLPPISCSEDKEKVDIRVFEVQNAVEEWEQEVSELRSQYAWLLYFSIPKMLLLFKLLKSRSQSIDAIVHEVSFIVYNQKVETTELRQGVLVSFEIT